jgi:hypothetical protein
MPLAPLPEDNTGRLFVNYNHEGIEHEVQFRQLSPFTQADVVGWAQSWLQANDQLFQTNVNFHSADWAAAGSNVRNPVTWTPVVGSSAPAVDPTRLTRSFSFVGRSPDGRKLRIFFYGGKFGPDHTYRAHSSEDADIASAVAGLNALTSRVGTISGSAPIFKPYVNIRNNSYWQTELRG